MEAFHYQPRTLDDELSMQVFDAWIETLDEEALLFTQPILDSLADFRTTLDDAFQSEDCAYFEAISTIYFNRIKTTLAYLETIAELPYTDALPLRIDWYTEEDLPTYASNQVDWETRWRIWLQFQTLRQWFQQTPDSLASDFTAFRSAYPTLRAKAYQRINCQYERLLTSPEIMTEAVGVALLERIAEVYDPHSAYFAPLDKEAFEAALAKETQSFGLYLEDNDEQELEIAHLVPGGPAWKSNELNQGDIIISIQFAGDDPLDLTCLTATDVSAQLETAPSTRVTLKVRKPNGQMRSVSLIQEEMTVEENVISGFVLVGERKVGYIYLPGFYAAWEDSDRPAMGCANDIAKEIIKLQTSGIEGLILDVRYNGGGAMNEAIGLAGIFIDQGPLSIITERLEKPYLMKDFNRGVMFRGPLIVMVNGMSASASEMFAAAMQDYRRGLIVGTPTYGKATGQVIFGLDEGDPGGGGEGFAKITMSKFYRVTEASHQQIGIQPDILLPEVWDQLIPRESDEPFALSRDSVDKPVTFKPLPAIPIAPLAQASADRLAQDERFQQLSTLRDTLPRVVETTDRLTPTFSGYWQDMRRLRSFRNMIRELPSREATVFEVTNHLYKANIVAIDPAQAFSNTQQRVNIEEDVYIEEAYRIMLDWLEQP